MNIQETTGSYAGPSIFGSYQPSAETLEAEARSAFTSNGHLEFSVLVYDSKKLIGYVSADVVPQKTIVTDDSKQSVYDSLPGTKSISQHEGAVSAADAIALGESQASAIKQAGDYALMYRYDVFVADSDISNYKIEVTKYNVDVQTIQKTHRPLFLNQALDVLNGEAQ